MNNFSNKGFGLWSKKFFPQNEFQQISYPHMALKLQNK